MAKSRRRSLRGRGKVADWFRQAAKDVGGFVKKHHLLSRGGNFLKGLNVLPPQYNAALGVASGLAKKAGYGRMAGRGTHLAGGSMASTIKRAHRVGSLTYRRPMPHRGGALRLAGARKY